MPKIGRWGVVCIGLAAGFISTVNASESGAGGSIKYSKNRNTNFAELVNQYAEGQPARTPWAGYWWPYIQDGIAKSSDGENALAKYARAKAEANLAEVWEKKFHGKKVPQVQPWWGHCNGWAAASVLFPEPREPVTVNGVTFTVADMKAILTEVGMNAAADFFGESVRNWDNFESPEFADTIPDQYFLVLTNYMGRQKKGIIIDRYTGHQVWNVPLVGYRFEYPKPEDYLGVDPDNSGLFKIRLTSTIWWVEDRVAPDTLTPPFSFEENSFFGSRKLDMELWLDGPVVFAPSGKILSSGNVVVKRVGENLLGGEWLGDAKFSVNGHPDYMWVPHPLEQMADLKQDYVNPHLDLDWILKNLVKDPTLSQQRLSDEKIEPKSPYVAYAEGWSELIIQANAAKTKIQANGHFHTDRNACGAEASGVLSLEDWNLLALYLNRVVSSSLGEEENCFSHPEFYPYLDRSAELKLLQGDSNFISVFNYKNEKICTHLSDRKLANSLLKLIHKTIVAVDREDCKNGWSYNH